MVLVLLLITTNVCYSQTREELKKLLAYYLEKDDSLQIAKQIIIDQNIAINNRELTIEEKNDQISIYKSDSTQFINIIDAEKVISKNRLKEINILIEDNKKKINRLKWKLAGAIGIIIIETAVIILLL